MIQPQSIHVLNENFLRDVFSFFDLKQLCKIEQISKLWEKTAKNHSNWASFAGSIGIPIKSGEISLKNQVIFNRISYCIGYTFKILPTSTIFKTNKAKQMMLDFQKSSEQKCCPSSILVLEMSSQIAQDRLMSALSFDYWAKIADYNDLMSEIQYCLNSGAVVDENACTVFFENPYSLKFTEVSLYILQHCKDPSEVTIQSECYLYLANYIHKVKKNKDFNMQFVIPERLMVEGVPYQNFITKIPDFFQSGLNGMLNEIGIVFSDDEKELITKKLNEFAMPLIEQFKPPK